MRSDIPAMAEATGSDAEIVARKSLMECRAKGDRVQPLKPGQTATADEIKATAAKSAEAGHISRYAVPDEIRFVEELARTSVGKADKKRMRADYAHVYEGSEP